MKHVLQQLATAICMQLRRAVVRHGGGGVPSGEVSGLLLVLRLTLHLGSLREAALEKKVRRVASLWSIARMWGRRGMVRSLCRGQRQMVGGHFGTPRDVRVEVTYVGGSVLLLLWKVL